MDHYSLSSERLSCDAQPQDYDYPALAPSQHNPDAFSTDLNALQVSSPTQPDSYDTSSQTFSTIPSYYPLQTQPYGAQYFGGSGNADYADPQMSNQSVTIDEYSPNVPLYAPVPLSAYTALLSSSGSDVAQNIAQPDSSPSSQSCSEPYSPNTSSAHDSPLDYYLNAPQVMFPTPCELLTDLSARSERDTGADAGPASDDAQTVVFGRSPVEAAVSPPSSSQTRKAKTTEKQPENQRKAYFRSVAESIGFQPTDPDTISSHDKKRSYLECLEQYVQWLHEQIHLVGHEPVAIERVSTYRGLNSRSMRTLLVHMQDNIRKLHVQMVQQEGEFITLQDQLLSHQASANPDQFRRHSTSGGMIPENPMAPFFPPTEDWK